MPSFLVDSLLYIAMVFTTAGGTALSAKEYLPGTVFLVLGAITVVVRFYLKKHGYNTEEKTEE